MTDQLDYAALYHLSRALKSLELPSLAQSSINGLSVLVNARYGLLVLHNDAGGTYNAWQYQSADAPPRPTPLPWEALLDRGLAGFVYHSGRVVVIPDVARDPRWPNLPNLPRRGSAIGMPLHDGEGIFGLVLLLHNTIDYFDTQRVALLTEGVDTITEAMRHAFDHSLLQRQAEMRDGLVIAPVVAQGEVQAKLSELEQLRSDLAAMIYHDMRNPLQTIKLSLHRLSQMLANHENAAVMTMLQTSTHGTRQLKRMVDSLLDIQRLEEGHALLNTSQTNLRTLLAEAAQLAWPLAQEAEIKMKFDAPATLPEIMIDGDMIARVVTNLIENAIKYTPNKGTVGLRASMLDHNVIISVRDSGPGVPVEMKETIFDKFSRVNYKNAPSGVGLGLTFCRLAVEAHGGEIWVESEPGKGSEFIFVLPMNVISVPSTDCETEEDTSPVESIALAG